MKNTNYLKTKIISEIGLSHFGSIDHAINLIDKSKKSGADYVKFQTHIADAESTLDEKFRIKFSKKYVSRYDYWKRTEFTLKEWKYIKNYCDKNNIGFFSSPFSIEAAKLLSKLNVKLWKISSGEFFNRELINFIIRKPGKILISTGMSSMTEIKDMINLLRKHKKKFSILQCTTEYPVKLEEIGFNVIKDLKEKFNCNVGLSDHSGSIYPGLLAISQGLEYLEIHCCDTKNDFGPDVSSSLTFKDIKFLSECRDKFDILKKSLVKKTINKKTNKMRKLFTKSLCLKRNMNSGEIIKKRDLTLKKPGGGLKENQISKIIGKRLKKKYSYLRILKKSDITF